MKKITKTLAIIFSIFTISLSAIACSPNKKANKLINSSDISLEETQNNLVKQEQVEEETIINGIYKFTKTDYTYNDKYFNDIEELTKFFNTHDENGVYNEISKLEFDKFLKDISYINYNGKTTEKTFLFSNNKIYDVAYFNNNFKVLNDGIQYTINNNIINIDEKLYTFNYNENNDTINLKIRFSYKNSANLIIKTPLYISTTLEKVYNSENLNNVKTYKYNDNSLLIKSKSTESIDFDKYSQQLKTMFNIQDENVNEKIIEILKNKNISFDFNITKLILTQVDNNAFSIITANDDKSFTINNSNFIITTHNLDLTTNIKTISFKVQLDNDAYLTFDYTSNN